VTSVPGKNGCADTAFQRCTGLLFQGGVSARFSIDEVHGPPDPGFLIWNHLVLKRFFTKLVALN
jgi:hypothetical protein